MPPLLPTELRYSCSELYVIYWTLSITGINWYSLLLALFFPFLKTELNYFADAVVSVVTWPLSLFEFCIGVAILDSLEPLLMFGKTV